MWETRRLDERGKEIGEGRQIFFPLKKRGGGNTKKVDEMREILREIVIEKERKEVIDE